VESGESAKPINVYKGRVRYFLSVGCESKAFEEIFLKNRCLIKRTKIKSIKSVFKFRTGTVWYRETIETATQELRLRTDFGYDCGADKTA
jgi:hypothetical protein